MKIKRYYAPNMKAALSEASKEFGKEAVILSSRSQGDGVEVLAAADFDESILKKNTLNLGDKITPDEAIEDKLTQNVAQHVHELPTEKSIWQTDPSMNAMQDRIKNLEALLKAHLSYQEWQEIEMHSPCKAAIAKKLTEKGFSSQLIKLLLKQLTQLDYVEIAWQETMHLLAEMIKIDQDFIVEQAGIYAFFGTTGVGKTTTIAKLAARYALRYSPDNVALVTTDVYKIAAKEQLAIYAKILNVPFHVVSNKIQLDQVLYRLRGKKLVLIDTAGFSHFDQEFTEQFNLVCSSPYPIQTVGLLSATTANIVLNEIALLFNQLKIKKTIITKLDESTQIAPLLSTLIQSKLSISYICSGQKVPEDIQQARAIDLVREACACELSSCENNWSKLIEAVGIQVGETHVREAG